MKAIMVSVDYSDLLSVTLPYNRHHFDEVWIVTSSADHATAQVAGANGAKVVVTDKFYERGAAFNKWAALEHGLDAMGRDGWLCMMDADVLWPRDAEVRECLFGRVLFIGNDAPNLTVGNLCAPLRRMWDDWPDCWSPNGERSMSGSARGFFWGQHIPPEHLWDRFPIHRNTAEWAGYSQIFHASDPALGLPPWHEVDWRHAGGADSFFQAKWKPGQKVRPPFEVLHLGPAGQNWFGRATPRSDGTLPPDAAQRRDMSARQIWEARRANRAAGRDQFEGEKVR